MRRKEIFEVQVMQDHEKYMLRCLELAERGLGATAPNPLVGAVVVWNDQIIGEGFHERFGGPHAEVNAVESVSDKSLLSQSSLYVNLEPCCHFGKTPPCTDLIIRSGIPKVLFGSSDPFPEVSGKGEAVLKNSGVEVTKDILRDECINLNRRFFIYQLLKRPYVILKWAETSDGFIARRDFTSKWISSDESRALVHQWRAQESAVMVGYRTALYDNPQLTVRAVKGRNPVRVVLDRDLSLPQRSHLLDRKNSTIVFNSVKADESPELSYVKVRFDQLLLPNVMKYLFERKVLSIMVEGGAALLKSLIISGLWDEMRIFTAAKLFGDGILAPRAPAAPEAEMRVGGDTLRTYYNQRSLELILNRSEV
jgi:diaminohydroxyphosphoribosylaminopyrimidine deaminase / 5-amino-6-(5-phosphoribosylamino)uracil reductase